MDVCPTCGGCYSSVCDGSCKRKFCVGTFIRKECDRGQRVPQGPAHKHKKWVAKN